jgi:glycosyltransferase involved in cell wall biosynthesis
MIPVLFITYNRLEYTKQALGSLLLSDCGKIFIIDNNSTDGTKEFLATADCCKDKIQVVLNDENIGIAGAMNQFLALTKDCEFVGKVDNDTVVPRNWCSVLLSKLKACELDIIQAKHNLDPAVTKGKTFDQWMQTMKQHAKDESVYLHHFVGGSGIVFRRNIVSEIPQTEWKLYGWRQFQRENPQLKTAFTTDLEIELLDGGGDYSAYPYYYKETKRLV